MCVCVCVCLGEQLSDLAVDVAQEVHVRGAAVETLILHQLLPEQNLGPVLLTHHQNLGEGRESERGRKRECVCESV